MVNFNEIINTFSSYALLEQNTIFEIQKASYVLFVFCIIWDFRLLKKSDFLKFIFIAKASTTTGGFANEYK